MALAFAEVPQGGDGVGGLAPRRDALSKVGLFFLPSRHGISRQSEDSSPCLSFRDMKDYPNQLAGSPGPGNQDKHFWLRWGVASPAGLTLIHKSHLTLDALR